MRWRETNKRVLLPFINNCCQDSQLSVKQPGGQHYNCVWRTEGLCGRALCDNADVRAGLGKLHKNFQQKNVTQVSLIMNAADAELDIFFFGVGKKKSWRKAAFLTALNLKRNCSCSGSAHFPSPSVTAL